MAVQGWTTNNLSSTSALLLCKRIECASQQSSLIKTTKLARKERNQRHNAELLEAAEAGREQRRKRQEDMLALHS